MICRPVVSLCTIGTVRAQGTLANVSPAHQESASKPWAEVPGPTAYPIIGNGNLFFKKENSPMPKLYKNLRNSFGDVYKTTMFGDTFLNIHNPEDVKTLLSKDGAYPVVPGFDNFIKIREEYQAEHFGDTLGLISQGDDWYKFRKAVQQDMMRPKSALYYIEDIENIAIEFTDKVISAKDKNGYVDIGKFCQEFALDSISCIFLGGKIGALGGSKDAEVLIENMNLFMKYGIFIFMLPFKIVQWMPFFKKVVNASTDNTVLITKYIDMAKEKIDMEDESILGKLIQKHGKDSKIPVVMAVDAINAGIDTTGNTAILLLYHLAKNPEKQEKLYEEIKLILGKDGNLSSSALSKMRYLKACQQESQRMLPVTNNGLIRKTQVDMVLGGYQVPTGTKVVAHSANNCEESFSNPQSFRPERWLRGNPEEHQANAFANIPFSHGPRSCIGQRFAKLELYILIAKMIQRFQVEYHGEDVDVKSGLVGAPDKQVILSVRER